MPRTPTATPTRRTELIDGIIDSAKRDALDALYTLLYHAEQGDSAARSDQLVRAIDALNDDERSNA